jgi:quaternary ammonium compound-resistance protein SugE
MGGPIEGARLGVKMSVGQKSFVALSEGGNMNWVILVVAGLFEVGWAIGLKYTAGFTRVWPTIWTVLAMIVSLWLLGIAMKGLPVGTAYSVWVGVGSVGTVILGIVLLGEPASPMRLISVAFIIAGIIGLKLSAG